MRVDGFNSHVQASQVLGRDIGHFVDERVVEHRVFGRGQHPGALPHFVDLTREMKKSVKARKEQAQQHNPLEEILKLGR